MNIVFYIMVSYILIFMMLKNQILFSSIFMLDSSVMFLFFIFPFILMLILNMNFNFSSYKENYTYIKFFIFIILMVFLSFMSNSSFLFLIMLESSVMMMMLIIFWFSKDKDKMSASIFMFLLNIFPSILFMYFCYNNLENNNFMFYNTFFNINFLELVCFLGLLVSKLPIFIFHFWLGKAHVSAPGSGSMLLASLMLKIGVIGFYKFYNIFLEISMVYNIYFFILSIMGSVYILILMSRFFDLKFLVACSSIIHMSPVFPMILFGKFSGFYASIIMMVGHGLISFFIFYLVSIMYEISYSRSMDFNLGLNSVYKELSMFLLFFFLMNLGFPPFINFLSEIFFLEMFYFFSYYMFFFFLLVLLISGLLFFFILSFMMYSDMKLMFNTSTLYKMIHLSMMYLFIIMILPIFLF